VFETDVPAPASLSQLVGRTTQLEERITASAIGLYMGMLTKEVCVTIWVTVADEVLPGRMLRVVRVLYMVVVACGSTLVIVNNSVVTCSDDALLFR